MEFLLVEVEETTTIEVSWYDQGKTSYYSLRQPLKCALYDLGDFAGGKNHKVTEHFRYEEVESLHTVIGIRSRGIERWG